MQTQGRDTPMQQITVAIKMWMATFLAAAIEGTQCKYTKASFKKAVFAYRFLYHSVCKETRNAEIIYYTFHQPMRYCCWNEVIYPIHAPSTLAKAASQKLTTCRIRALTYTTHRLYMSWKAHLTSILAYSLYISQKIVVGDLCVD